MTTHLPTYRFAHPASSCSYFFLPPATGESAVARSASCPYLRRVSREVQCTARVTNGGGQTGQRAKLLPPPHLFPHIQIDLRLSLQLHVCVCVCLRVGSYSAECRAGATSSPPTHPNPLSQAPAPPVPHGNTPLCVCPLSVPVVENDAVFAGVGVGSHHGVAAAVVPAGKKYVCIFSRLSYNVECRRVWQTANTIHRGRTRPPRPMQSPVRRAAAPCALAGWPDCAVQHGRRHARCVH